MYLCESSKLTPLLHATRSVGRSVAGWLVLLWTVHRRMCNKKRAPTINSPRLSLAPSTTPLHSTKQTFLVYSRVPVCSLCEYAGQPHYSHFLILPVSLSLSRCSSGAATAGCGGGDAGRREAGHQRGTAVPLRPGGGQPVQRQVVQGAARVFPLHAQGDSARANVPRARRPNQCKSDSYLVFLAPHPHHPG